MYQIGKGAQQKVTELKYKTKMLTKENKKLRYENSAITAELHKAEDDCSEIASLRDKMEKEKE